MVTVKRVVILAIASLLMAAVMGVDRLYGDGASQDQRQGADQRRHDRDDPQQKRWGSEQAPQAGVCFYDDKDFRGQYFCVGPGEDLAQLPQGMGDKISSLRIIDSVEVVVFKDAKFKGVSGRFLTDVRDLRKEGWNDQISSVRVRNASVAWERDRLPAWGNERVPNEGACFYRDSNFHGDYFCVPRGASYEAMPGGFNDQISSIRIIGSGGVLISEDSRFAGRGRRVTSDIADLQRDGWNDKISSIRVF